MAKLALNGIEVAAAEGAAELRFELVGDNGRGVDGAMFTQRTAVKRQLDVTTAPLTQQEALALMGLVHGEGHVWDFSATRGLYSSRGSLITGSGSVTRVGSFGQFGGDSAEVAIGATLRTNVLYVAGSATAPSPTLSMWLSLNGSSWRHWVYVTTTAQWYEDGSASAAPAGVSISYHATHGWQIANASGAKIWVDDLWLCPYEWPATWPAYVAAAAAPAGLCPRVAVRGELLERNVVTLQMFGEVMSGAQFSGVLAGARQVLQPVGFSLYEV